MITVIVAVAILLFLLACGLGCSHDWEIFGQTERFKSVNRGAFWEKIPYTRFHLRCKNCGKLKKKDL